MNEVKTLSVGHKVEDGQLKMVGYETIKDQVEEIKSEMEALTIGGDNYKRVQEVRILCDKADKELTKIENNFKKDFMNDFLTKSQDLKKELKEIVKGLKEKEESYEKEVGTYRPKQLNIVFKTKDENLANEILKLVESKFSLKGEIK